MGFPLCYTDLQYFPKLLLHFLSILGFIKKLISTLLTILGLHHFLEPDPTRPVFPHPIRPDQNPGFVRKLISILLTIEFPDPTRSEFLDPTRPGLTRSCSASAGVIRELLPVVRFSDMVDPPESCAVCLYEFDWTDEIRRLTNCCHVFHRSCVDRWMDHDQNTCPLCRKEFIPEDMMGIFNEKLWLAYGISDFHEEYSSMSSGS